MYRDAHWDTQRVSRAGGEASAVLPKLHPEDQLLVKVSGTPTIAQGR